MRDDELRKLFKEELPPLRAPEELYRELLRIPGRRRRLWWLLAPAPALAAALAALALLVGKPKEEPRFVVLPADGEVLTSDEVEIIVPRSKAVVIIDGQPLEPVKVNGEALFKPEDLEPGYHKVEVHLDDEVLERVFYTL